MTSQRPFPIDSVISSCRRSQANEACRLNHTHWQGSANCRCALEVRRTSAEKDRTHANNSGAHIPPINSGLALYLMHLAPVTCCAFPAFFLFSLLAWRIDASRVPDMVLLHCHDGLRAIQPATVLLQGTLWKAHVHRIHQSKRTSIRPNHPVRKSRLFKIPGNANYDFVLLNFFRCRNQRQTQILSFPFSIILFPPSVHAVRQHERSNIGCSKDVAVVRHAKRLARARCKR